MRHGHVEDPSSTPPEVLAALEMERRRYGERDVSAGAPRRYRAERHSRIAADPTDYRTLPFTTSGGPVTHATPALKRVLCDACHQWVQPGGMVYALPGPGIRLGHWPKCPVPTLSSLESSHQPKEVPVPSLPQPHSQKGRLFNLMLERATPGTRSPLTSTGKEDTSKTTSRGGWVGLTPSDMARLLGIPEHDVVHALHDMREQGLVEFKTSHAGRAGSDRPVNIRVTRAARAAGLTVKEGQPVVVVPHAPAPEPERDLVLIGDEEAEMADVADVETQEPDIFEPLPAEPTIALSDYPALWSLTTKVADDVRERVSKRDRAVTFLREAGLNDEADLAAAAVIPDPTASDPVYADAVRLIEALRQRGVVA